MILKTSVNYGGRIFAVGENVAGKIPLDYIELLRNNGHLQEDEAIELVEPDTPADKEFDLNAAANEVIKYINEIEAQEELDRISQLENERTSPRTTVLKAIDKRYEELEHLQTLGTLSDE